MVALQRAIRRGKKGKDGLVNVFSVSRSALELLTDPKTYHPLGHEARRDIFDIVAGGRAVRLFWNGEPEWQERYAEGSTGKITKCFFPRVEQAYRVLRKIEMTPQMAQTLTGHGRFAQYLHRFKLKNSPYCACDPAKIQNVLHVLEECPMFLRERVALETEIGVIVGKREFSTIIDDDKKKEKSFSGFVKRLLKEPQNYLELKVDL
ncbi:Retrovirus-related Pol polyprotein from type-1 retrotransposable element R1 3 [Eumeta japonica]|uniref:Retrovirus-related Pol polyprotein from type-1 retrotransposable element R1 3 n=1 Tax=Eumeta variegata TaxID=151549 RepID=A0A4C1ZQ75_EUMVA|nr:Retrovirus-related Pol polyprotein from type-1 retrotransposable element R1 3 [Eumeta japonica]